MKCVQVLIIISVTVIPSYVICYRDEGYIKLNRGKRQDGSWVWGSNGEETSNNNGSPQQPNPCTPFVSTKPNYNRGRRISEAKCLEYIWELKNRDDKLKHDNICFLYKKEEDAKRGIIHHAAVGGRITSPGEFPHMGALGWRAVIGTWLFMCGSSLISSKFLLTAAHCSKVSSKDTTVANTQPEIVRLGDKNIIDVYANGHSPVDKQILRFIVHPQYKPPKKYFDIALIELTTEVSFDKFIQPACLWSQADTSPLGTKASLTGWGTVDSAKQTTSPELQAAFVDIIDSDRCNYLLRSAFNRHFQGIQPHQICAGVLAGGVDACQQHKLAPVRKNGVGTTPQHKLSPVGNNGTGTTPKYTFGFTPLITPCTPDKSKMPNFTRRGRRLSETKCLEYLWELQNRDATLKSEACILYKKKLDERIGGFRNTAVGGRITTPGEFPHMGALGWRAVVGTWLFMCGSSLISSKFLLTAAHCSKISSLDTRVANTRPEIVRLGDKNIIDRFANNRKPLDKEILRFIVHPQYNSPNKYFDIGLIELTSEVKFGMFIQPACLWSQDDTSPLGTKASLTGWGTVDSAKQTTSPELQAAFVDIIDSDKCNDLLRLIFNRHFTGVRNDQICAGELNGGIDACQGDSGGPLQMKIEIPIKDQGSMSYVIGVTSFGVGCARANTPGVYTRVSSFIDWIERIALS